MLTAVGARHGALGLELADLSWAEPLLSRELAGKGRARCDGDPDMGPACDLKNTVAVRVGVCASPDHGSVQTRTRELCAGQVWAVRLAGEDVHHAVGLHLASELTGREERPEVRIAAIDSRQIGDLGGGEEGVGWTGGGVSARRAEFAAPPPARVLGYYVPVNALAARRVR